MGTHPIFESDFDCLTDEFVEFILVQSVMILIRWILFFGILCRSQEVVDDSGRLSDNEIEKEPEAGRFDEEIIEDKKVEEILSSDEGEANLIQDPIGEMATGDEANEAETLTSARIAFILFVLAICILCVHYLIAKKLHHVPESVSVVFIGAIVGFIGKILNQNGQASYIQEEMLSPQAFFVVLLPPIIFEAGYSLHKGNFFQNLGSIVIFAVFGTIISTLLVGLGLFLLGAGGVTMQLRLTDALAFGALISAVDPVATLAIFSAMDVEPVLNMLVFGESILNDAVSIVLCNIMIKLGKDTTDAGFGVLLSALVEFSQLMVLSAFLGIFSALVCALVLKHIDLRRNPSLEFGMMLAFSYFPYCCAEALDLSGITSILFAGIVMSHYAHQNLSLVTQINVQNAFRAMAFLAETSVFAYLGMAIFSFQHKLVPSFLIWTIILILIGRAVNIFPISWFLNNFRETRITRKMQFVMWFSGLRGAIAYAVSLHLDIADQDQRRAIITTSLCVVLFTILVLGGSTYPLVKWLKISASRKYDLRGSDSWTEFTKLWTRLRDNFTLSKTEEYGSAIDSEVPNELGSDEEDPGSDDGEGHLMNPPTEKLTRKRSKPAELKPLTGFAWVDARYLYPFFTRRITREELSQNRHQMRQLTSKWYQEVRDHHHESDYTNEL